MVAVPIRWLLWELQKPQGIVEVFKDGKWRLMEMEYIRNLYSTSFMSALDESLLVKWFLHPKIHEYPHSYSVHTFHSIDTVSATL